MSLTFKELWSELKEEYPKLSTFLCKRFIQRSWSDVRKAYQWGFLRSEGVLYTPPVITAGSFDVTQFSNTIIADATARTALATLSNPVITKRQVRFSNSIYSITDIDPAFAANGIITLDRPVMEASNVTTSYQIYRCYFGPPQLGINGAETTDFIRYNSIYDTSISRSFLGVQFPREQLNKLDSLRQSFTNPSYLFIYKSDSSGTPLFEMWPHSLVSRVLLASFQRRGTDLTLDTETLPLVIPDELILERAHWYACMWAEKMKGVYTELKGTNWLLMAGIHKKVFSNVSNKEPGLLELAQVEDEEVNPQIIVDNRTYRTYALGDDDLAGYANINP